MNEHESTIVNQQFELLERAMVEPRIARVEGMVKMYNDLLQTEDVSPEDATRIIRELNHEWGPLLHTLVTVSGGVYVSDLEGTARLADCEGFTFLSEGFMFFDEQNEDSDTIIRPRITHRLYLPLDESVRQETGLDYTSAAADVGTTMVQTSLASVERSLAWLAIFQPDLIEDIDAAILNGDGSEVESIMGLQDLSFRLDTDEDELGRSCIRAYLESVLEFDETVPYGVVIDGDIHLRMGEEAYFTLPMKDTKTLGYIKGIIPRSDDEGNYTLAAELTQAGRNRNVNGNTLLVPLASIKSLTSVRDTFYAA